MHDVLVFLSLFCFIWSGVSHMILFEIHNKREPLLQHQHQHKDILSKVLVDYCTKLSCLNVLKFNTACLFLIADIILLCCCNI